MGRTLPAVRLRTPAHEDASVRHRCFADPEVMECCPGGRATELSVRVELTARRQRHDAERGGDGRRA
ncbi:hypothetical protein ACWEQC_12200 [Streptomyces shenzhenensis]